MYSKLYYDERVKPTVEAEIGDQKISRTERFAIINKHLDTIYEQEPETLKEEIRRAIEEDRQVKESERELSTSVVTADESFGAKEYLLYVLYYNSIYWHSQLTRYGRAQSSLPDMIGDFLEAMAKRTGWSFSMIGGGPDGANDGKIRTISLHTGKDVYGQTFPKAIPDYKEAILVPYSKFLESVYRE